MTKAFRAALFAGTALAAVATGMPEQAAAQSQMPGFFGSVTGWYSFSGNNPKLTFKGNSTEDPFNRPDDGPGGKLHLGYRFTGALDIAFGLQGTWLGSTKEVNFTGPDSTLKSKAHYWAVDGELGYNTMMGSNIGLRLFAGARYARFNHDNHIEGTFFTDGMGVIPFFKNIDQRYTGIGPRVGFDFSARLGNSNFSIFGDAAASLLFGKLKSKFSGDPPCIGDCKDSDSRRVWNLEGQLGLGYEVTTNVTLGVGYRAEYWNHVADGLVSGVNHINRLMHGPFVRLAYNFGAPHAAPMAAVTPPPPPPPVGVGKSFIVFFDFDRSNITAQAQATINQAIAAAKAGNSTRITLTGHTDRSGSEQYNQALSIRRGEAVKAAMIRGGIPASAIVVIGKGESAPLVPTADGVREPQNRRVEIVI